MQTTSRESFDREFRRKVDTALSLMDTIHRSPLNVTTEVTISGSKVWLRMRTDHFTEKDRPRIHGLQKIVACEFVKTYTPSNRVKYSGNKDGVIVLMHTNIPASPKCTFTVKPKVQKRTFYSCPTKK